MSKPLTSDQVCDYYSISRRTLDKWMVQFKIPCFKIGRKLYFPPDRLQAWEKRTASFQQ